jgi:hypothetical protein
MHRLRSEDQVGKRGVINLFHFLARPVMARFTRGAIPKYARRPRISAQDSPVGSVPASPPTRMLPSLGERVAWPDSRRRGLLNSSRRSTKIDDRFVARVAVFIRLPGLTSFGPDVINQRFEIRRAPDLPGSCIAFLRGDAVAFGGLSTKRVPVCCKKWQLSASRSGSAPGRGAG